MKFAIICSFLLLCNSCRSETETDGWIAGCDTSSEVQFVVIDANGDGKHKLTHLKNYCYDVGLDLPQLLRLAKTNSTPISELNEAFRRKYPDYKIDVNQLKDTHSKYADNKRDKILSIFDYKTAYETLKYFGISIAKLKISNDFWDSESDRSRFSEIAKATNEFTAESLIQLEFSLCLF